MERAEVRDLYDRAAGWRLHRPWDGRFLVQGEVRAPLIIIDKEPSEGASQEALIPHDDVIETLTPQGPDQALDERILPRGARGNHKLLGAKTLQQATEGGSVAAVSIPQEILGRG